MERIKKEHRKKILDVINPETHEISWNEEGVPYKFKEKKKIKSGKTSRAKGARFELRVRHDLEEKGRTVDKWSNNVDLEEGKLIIAKRKYNPFSKVMTIGTGFPDFVTFSYVHDGFYSVIGVEVKVNGTLSKEEKEKCLWYIKNKIFSDIWIAKEKRNGRKIEVEYVNFREKYMKETNKT
ncbi:MAG: hypothetical protein KKB62_02280 [Nanoarchaeota archaeon]|nr:hypothetical protein [Nanoarchaeota archaeon]